MTTKRNPYTPYLRNVHVRQISMKNVIDESGKNIWFSNELIDLYKKVKNYDS